MVKGMRYPPEVLRKGEVISILNACSRCPTGTRDRAMIALLWRTGLRVSEMLALRPGDVDPDCNTVRVLHGKGDKDRVVGVDDHTLDLIAHWLTVRAAKGIDGRAPLFCTLKGTKLWGTHVRGMLKRRAVRAGVERRVTPHQFRHTYACELVNEGVSIAAIQEALGHASIVMTATYLRRIAPADQTALARSRPAWDE